MSQKDLAAVSGSIIQLHLHTVVYCIIIKTFATENFCEFDETAKVFFMICLVCVVQCACVRKNFVAFCHESL